MKWVRNFFTNRTQQTRVGYSLSALVDLLSGVVQGSGLGVVSFLIFIDDLAKVLETMKLLQKKFAIDMLLLILNCHVKHTVKTLALL